MNKVHEKVGVMSGSTSTNLVSVVAVLERTISQYSVLSNEFYRHLSDYTCSLPSTSLPSLPPPSLPSSLLSSPLLSSLPPTPSLVIRHLATSENMRTPRASEEKEESTSPTQEYKGIKTARMKGEGSEGEGNEDSEFKGKRLKVMTRVIKKVSVEFII